MSRFLPQFFSSFFKRITLVTTTSLLLTSPVYAEKLVDRVVAVVNSEVILLSDLDAETELIEQRILMEVPKEEQQNTIFHARDEALNSIIDKRLINQKAAEARVSVNEKEVDAAIADVQKRAGLSAEQFEAELNRTGLSMDTYRDNIRSQLLQRKIVSYDIRSRIVIPESQIQEYYEGEYTVQATADEFYLLQLGLTWDDNTKAKSQKEIEQLHKRAMDGADFAVLAREHSTLPSAAEGGDIGTFTLEDMSGAMAQAIAPLTSGEVSPIIEMPGVFQFFKVVSTGGNKEISKAPYDQVKERIRAILFEQEMQKAFQKWVTELKEDAYIQKIQ